MQAVSFIVELFCTRHTSFMRYHLEIFEHRLVSLYVNFEQNLFLGVISIKRVLKKERFYLQSTIFTKVHLRNYLNILFLRQSA